MGNKKNTLLIFVVVILFIASGVVLYNGFVKSPGTNTINTVGGGKEEIVNLLPYGTKLDFDPVEKHADSGANIVYEKVDPKNVAVDVHSLISPVKDETPAQVNVPTQRGQRIQ